jgi:hypothetical protein
MCPACLAGAVWIIGTVMTATGVTALAAHSKKSAQPAGDKNQVEERP